MDDLKIPTATSPALFHLEQMEAAKQLNPALIDAGTDLTNVLKQGDAVDIEILPESGGVIKFRQKIVDGVIQPIYSAYNYPIRVIKGDSVYLTKASSSELLLKCREGIARCTTVHTKSKDGTRTYISFI